MTIPGRSQILVNVVRVYHQGDKSCSILCMVGMKSMHRHVIELYVGMSAIRKGEFLIRHRVEGCISLAGKTHASCVASWEAFSIILFGV